VTLTELETAWHYRFTIGILCDVMSSEKESLMIVTITHPAKAAA